MAGLAAVLVFAGCASHNPSVKVIGIDDRAPTNSLLVFVEVENPTRNDLQLSRLQYKIDAGTWFGGSGEVPLTRAVPPRSTTIVKLQVPVHGQSADAAVPYTLRGKLFATDERIERFWSVKASGALSPRTGLARPIRIRVANRP